MSMVNNNEFKVKQSYNEKFFVRTSENSKLMQVNEIVDIKKIRYCKI